MFSYLHGIWPNNRRSAIPQATAPPQNTTSRYYHEAPSPNQDSSTFNLDSLRPRTSQSNILYDSPVSPNPPILPPIPRVASQRESERAEERDDWTYGDGLAHSEPQKRPQQEAPSVPPILVPSNSYSTLMASKDRPNRTSGGSVTEQSPTRPNQDQPQAPTSKPRPRRPIDAAYESMRSYNEPLHRQFLGTQPENQPFIPEPLRRPPPPPPKPPHLESEPQRQAPPLPGKTPQQAQPAANQNRHSKTRLNLLNPMSLLARRRSSQAVEEAYSQSQTTSGMRLPDDYDPRIRGKVVHDFSAPRPGRNNSSSESSIPIVQIKEKRESSEISQKKISPNPGSSIREDESPSSAEREHTPVFKENFDDNVESWHDDLDSPAKRRTSALMYKMSLQESQPEPDPSSLPAFARALPPKVPPKDVQTISSSIDAIRKASSPSPKPLEKVLEDPLPNQESAKPFPPMSPPKTRSRSTSLSDPMFDGPGSPRRYKSNASRFSFDLAGVGSAAQEQLLEERHRQQKAKRKERESALSDGNEMYDEDEYADYDDMDDDDGLEERIPGVNADDEDFELPLVQQATETSFISPNKSSFDSASSPVSTGLTSPGTPRDSQSQPSGSLVSNSSPKLTQRQHEVAQSLLKENSSRPKSVPGVASGPGFNVQPLPREIASESNLAGLPSRYEYQDDDDMYFDDGMIEDLDDGENEGFDESVFDDDTSRVYGLPLRDLKPLSVAQNPNNLMISQVKGQETHLAPQSSINHDTRIPTLPELPEDDATAAELMDSITDLKQPTRGSLSQAAGLTQDNLGLHDQLAIAANQAELAGRFQRSYSLASTHESNDGFDPSAEMRFYNSQLSLPANNFSCSRTGEDTEDFAFDDAHIGIDDEEADDTIIAAANAEALENDDDGFYGQEFGFFARASGSSESEYVHGGYFGPRVLEGIHRMNSGRENKDPSLTPITERSEWSNRNSAISLAMHGYPLSAQYPSNPQLASLMNLPEDEMSLEALQKLRRGAWGGSNGSLRSSNNSQNSGSPLTYLPPGMIVPSLLQPANSKGHMVNASNQNLAGSFHSFSSSNGHPSSADSDPSPLLESPTITLSTSQPGLYIQQPMGPPPPPPPPPPAENTSPVRRSAVVGKSPWAPSHSRNSSGAESVSYREEGGKWVFEKRRVDATGEIEVLGRGIVEGGRI